MTVGVPGAADTVTIGLLVVPHYGTSFARMRQAWTEADQIGVDRIYTADHFLVPRPAEYEGQHLRGLGQRPSPELLRVVPEGWTEPPCFEATTTEAAMCATTRRAEVSCLVHCNAYRNPNLLADMARTMDHISDGRFVLGIGSGFHEREFEEYGYEYTSFASRLRDLDRDIPIIRSRWTQLVPPPIRRIPILMVGTGEKLALQVVARHADEWQCIGPLDELKRKSAILDDWCERVGRDPKSIRRAAAITRHIQAEPDDVVEAGFTHLIATCSGPDWDLDPLRELLAWRGARFGTVGAAPAS
jgi:probable F420-dependent oxidoreductase